MLLNSWNILFLKYSKWFFLSLNLIKLNNVDYVWGAIYIYIVFCDESLCDIWCRWHIEISLEIDLKMNNVNFLFKDSLCEREVYSWKVLHSKWSSLDATCKFVDKQFVYKCLKDNINH